MKSSYGKLPEWLRWALLLPLTLLFAAIIGGIIHIIRGDAALVQPLFVMLAVMVAAHTLAPRAKRHVALAALLVRLLISCIVLCFVWLNAGYFERTTGIQISIEFISFGIALAIWWKYMR